MSADDTSSPGGSPSSAEAVVDADFGVVCLPTLGGLRRPGALAGASSIAFSDVFRSGGFGDPGGATCGVWAISSLVTSTLSSSFAAGLAAGRRRRDLVLRGVVDWVALDPSVWSFNPAGSWEIVVVGSTDAGAVAVAAFSGAPSAKAALGRGPAGRRLRGRLRGAAGPLGKDSGASEGAGRALVSGVVSSLDN